MSDSRVKVATHAMGRERLRNEAAMLRKAQHPGVVALRAFTDDADQTQLVLVAVDGSTLADEPPADAAVGLRMFAALARTVADLHSLGVAHERLSADHVLLTRDQRPVLCGFAEATADAGEDGRGRDCSSLLDLLELIAVGVGASQRAPRGLAPRPGGSRAAVALRRLAIELRRQSEQPSSVELAERAGRLALRHRSPARSGAGRTPLERTAVERPRAELSPATHPRSLPTRHRKPDDRRSATATAHRGGPRGAALGIGASLIFAVIVGLARHAGDPSLASSTGPTSATGSAAATTTLTESLSATLPTTARPTAAVPVRMKAGGSQYEVGQLGDQVVVADWACTGEPTTALLRPSTGDVYLFDALPGRGETVTGHRVATVADAVALDTDDANQACPPLTVRDRAGATHEIGIR